MAPPYSYMPRIALIHNFCSRQPELYLDMFELAKNVDRRGLIRILLAMDLDRDEGSSGPLLRPPPRPKS